MSSKPHIIILGAGPAGLGAAYRLTKKTLASVTVIEQDVNVGGIAGSFNISGINADYGSHRLHPACDPEILNDLQILLGDELLNRPRHGRIRLQSRWIHFPLKPFDLALKLPLSFSLGTATDLVRRSLGDEQKSPGSETFATVLESGLGRTICREFYFPYTQKIWGLPPDEISPIQAHRRVSANSLKKMSLKILTGLPGFKSSKSGHFFYPKKGFGQISSRLYDVAKNSGANFYLNTPVEFIQMNGDTVKTVSTCSSSGKIVTDQLNYVWSTIPISTLVKLMQPSAPASIIEASQNMQYRAMILVYLVLEQARFSDYDAHYFPGSDIPITRISEPKNYSNAKEPQNLSVLCAELPCSKSDPEWKMTDSELGDLVCDCLKSASIPIKAPIKMVVTRRLSHAYPIYQTGYELYFDQVDHWLSQAKNLISFGRQGLFVHDNIHHALYMAYTAVNCLNDKGQFDRNKWQCHCKKVFNSHVVED